MSPNLLLLSPTSLKNYTSFQSFSNFAIEQTRCVSMFNLTVLIFVITVLFISKIQYIAVFPYSFSIDLLYLIVSIS